MTTLSWTQANQQYLMQAVARLRELLQGCDPATQEPQMPPSFGTSAPPALEQICQMFGLSRFERDVLLLCAGVELDSSFAEAVATARPTERGVPTFGLALAALPDAHWSALTPAAPLRRWRLIEVAAADKLTTAPLRIDERVLHYLAGVSYLDDRLRGMLEPVAPGMDLAPSHSMHVEAIVRSWTAAENSAPPIVQLCGEDARAIRNIASIACARLNHALYVISASAIPHQAGEFDAFLRLWQREVLLGRYALLVEFSEGDTAAAHHHESARRVFDETQGLVMCSARTPRPPSRREALVLDVEAPSAAERKALWHASLGKAAEHMNGQLDTLNAQFHLSADAIRAACSRALHQTSSPEQLDGILWDACRIQARSRIDDLAQRSVPAARWEDLVLPASQMQVLREIAVHVRQRSKVYGTWGFARKSARGLGISALFAGPSGTGKTMAAEVLANELRLDLHRVDLSQMVSKYIGETEKNLRRAFDAAEAGGSILLFDEADALFGKRSEVKDSHDRYANVEISYLLQRMEAYRGLTVLTTNMKSALDTAFMRRIRFVVQFPFPDAAQRAEIWRRAFPEEAPVENLDYERLARLQVAGGNIRNISMHAAFLAAERGEPVRMTHLMEAARGEYAKLERPLSDAELGRA